MKTDSKKRNKGLKVLAVVVVILLVVIVAALLLGGEKSKQIYSNADELRGKKIAAITGAATGGMLERYYDGDVEIEYFNSNSDMAAALRSGKVDAYIADKFAGKLLCTTYTNQIVLEETPIQVNPFGFFFDKDSAKGIKLCEEMNVLIDELSKSGKLEELEKKWSGKEKAEIDIELTGENGTIKYSCCSSIGKPFCFVQDNKIVGYEMEIAYLFCQKYGYDLEFLDSDYGGMLTAVASGKTDIGGTSTSITEERKKTVLFSTSTMALAFDLVVVGSGDSASGISVLEGIGQSIKKTFVDESRWQLYVDGILTTLLITIASVLLGTILGLAVFVLCYNGRKLANKIANGCMWVIQGMPVVVLLMVLYYIVFGNTDLSGTFISIIAFTLIFACSFIGMLKGAYDAVGYGQTEAAIALGYAPFQALRQRIFPQMVTYFKKPYQEGIVSLLKSTSIVGYIAVMDLTRVGDIIRGVTYEAFFPLIVTTIVYFILAGLLGTIVKQIFKLMDNRRRTPEQILKGVDIHD